MTDIYVNTGKKQMTVSVRGHCAHDVCVSVSALTQALIQYTIDFRDEHAGFRTEALLFGFGHSLITVFCDDKKLMERYLAGTEAILTGYEVFAQNFPQEIRLCS